MSYSRINIGFRKAHIFDHTLGRTLCGTPTRSSSPNKKIMGASEMLFRHRLIHQRRGGPNPYKLCCKSCERAIEEASRPS